ncbi:MAG TPA: alkaline phosphatase family protein [Allosphingosinicella sp.]|nr:alkaline phosphatase family protein [Allosphingosinicella sp.]
MGYTVSISIRNDCGGEADIALFHSGSLPPGDGIESGAWTVAAGQAAGPLTVAFDPDDLNTDFWAVSVFVKNGPNAGLYVNDGDTFANWIECQLEESDGGTSPVFSVSATNFDVALVSGGCSNAMSLLARLSQGATAAIGRVFVVMLENRSFDHVFAWSGLPGIDVADTGNSNSYDYQGSIITANFTPGAPKSLPTDPGHEFDDVLVQLCGPMVLYRPGEPYPATDNKGFVASYATSTSEPPNVPPPITAIGDVMRGFTTAKAMPNLYALARDHAICDHWHASMPGPTWPNRFFIHGASSSGLDDSPTDAQTAEWEAKVPAGFQYANGSIFDRLTAANIPFALYSDFTSDWLSAYSDDPQNGSRAGAVPQAGSITNVSAADFSSLGDFASDLKGPYPYAYTFIEPHYGDISGGTYEGGSSQHPMDDVVGGDRLLGAVYNAIAGSPHWGSSLLVITYDEHGGLYDKVTPPTGVAAPGDDPDFGYNIHKFDFTTLGVRVPAVLVSPLIAAGTVSHAVYDHSSVPKLLEQLWGLASLTDRDARAESPLQCVTLAAPRTDAALLPEPARRARRGEPRTTPPAEREALLSRPVPKSGNLVGTLAVLRKTDLELSGTSPAARAALEARWAAIKTRGDVEAYARDVLAKVSAERARRRAAARRPRPA